MGGGTYHVAAGRRPGPQSPLAAAREAGLVRHDGPMRGFLQVEVTTARQARRATAEDVDRLVVVKEHDFGLGSPAPDDVAEIRAATTVDLRVLLRLRAGFGTDGGEITRLRGLIWSYLEAGADGFQFGFLNDLGQLDVPVLTALGAEGDWPWTCDRVIDSAFDPAAAWAAVVGLPRLDGVLTAGSARDLAHGLDHLLDLVADPVARSLVIAAGPTADQLPWLTRAGVRRFDLGLMGPALDTDRIASWRRLVPA